MVRNKRPPNHSNIFNSATQSIPPSIIEVENQVRHHPAVNRILQPCSIDDKGNVSIEAEFEVSLPSECKPAGITRTGVRAAEPVILDFPKAFPFRSPKIKLRKDFNRNLPHINPGDPRDYVYPCIYDGDLSELLHQTNGINEILDQIAEWLKKAASNSLIDPNQGWEAIRRDVIESTLIYDIEKMRAFVSNKFGSINFVCRYVRFDKYFMGVVYDYNPLPINRFLRLLNPNDDTVAILSWPDICSVYSEYLPETVISLRNLKDRATAYGCNDFWGQIQRVFDVFKNGGWKECRIIVILAVNRPYKLINDSSSVELIPYLVKCKPTVLGILDADSDVEPLGHRFMLTSKLLQQMSGSKKMYDREGPIVQLGCGSLGSKISLHLARSGYGPFIFADKDIFSPHNAARHALFEWRRLGNFKSNALKEMIDILGFKNESKVCNIVDNILDQVKRKKLIPDNTRLIIDSTASLSVREALASLSNREMQGRIVSTTMYASGEVGVMLIEGSERNPRIDDMIVKLYDYCIDQKPIAEKLRAENDPSRRHDIGQGCGSYTMVMSDARVSLYAAGIAERIKTVFEEDFCEHAELWIGLLEESRMGIEWEKLLLGKTSIINRENGHGWEIRILSDAAKKIHDIALASGNIENGGVLIGKVSFARRCINISRVLPAPPDSIRNGTTFVLGTEGLKDMIKTVQNNSGNLLTYIGTWHSHPLGGGPSEIDQQTIVRMKALRLGAPTINLIWTPSGFHALVDDGDISR